MCEIGAESPQIAGAFSQSKHLRAPDLKGLGLDKVINGKGSFLTKGVPFLVVQNRGGSVVGYVMVPLFRGHFGFSVALIKLIDDV